MRVGSIGHPSEEPSMLIQTIENWEKDLAVSKERHKKRRIKLTDMRDRPKREKIKLHFNEEPTP
jgi:hypothetical protein